MGGTEGGEEGGRRGRGARWADGEGVLERSGLEHREAGRGEEGVQAGEGGGRVGFELRGSWLAASRVGCGRERIAPGRRSLRTPSTYQS